MLKLCRNKNSRQSVFLFLSWIKDDVIEEYHQRRTLQVKEMWIQVTILTKRVKKLLCYPFDCKQMIMQQCLLTISQELFRN